MLSPGRSIAMAACLAPLLLTSALQAQTPKALTKDQIFAKLDPQMAEVILLFDAIKGTPIVNLTPQDARQQFAPEDAAKIIARGTGSQESPTPVVKVTDGLTIPGIDGNQIPIRIYTPAGSGPFPVTVYFHGGGFVIATIDTYDASARALCNDSNSIIVSVEYRKAPEAKFPAARHDAISAYQWTINNIGAHNGITSKVAVAGESAGGNLATEVAINARDTGMQKPTHQLLVYPVISGNLNQTSDILYTNSVLPLTTAALVYFYENYVTSFSQANDPTVAPIQANLKNLPPTTIIAAELDPLESDGELYRNKLLAAGNAVVYRRYPGTTHEFFGMGAVVDKAKAAEEFAGSQLAASFR